MCRSPNATYRSPNLTGATVHTSRTNRCMGPTEALAVPCRLPNFAGATGCVQSANVMPPDQRTCVCMQHAVEMTNCAAEPGKGSRAARAVRMATAQVTGTRLAATARATGVHPLADCYLCLLSQRLAAVSGVHLPTCSFTAVGACCHAPDRDTPGSCCQLHCPLRLLSRCLAAGVPSRCQFPCSCLRLLSRRRAAGSWEQLFRCDCCLSGAHISSHR